MYKLKENETGYDYVESKLLELISKFKGLAHEDYIVRIRYSYDNEDIDEDNEIITCYDGDFEFLDDWWEGQPYVEPVWAVPVRKLNEEGLLETYYFKKFV